MHRVTITLDDELMADLDAFISRRGYATRSEAVRDLARAGLAQASHDADGASDCVAALVYVYDHAQRDLSRKLVDAAHDHHDLSLATMHLHLDATNCMEITALRGKAHDVRHFAEHVIAERGVRHGRVVTIPVTGKTKTRPGR